ncbi:hypothetical protein PGT21_008284 [Puccinia graminis f. sp. tritici]|uniref:Uncharacterized protein n=1 Tax=Puccinia graminis f. sp. tritici TaxID=56615 RepID=A0A5B0LRA5_PUCGR|nr:hypothetical protein PGT21_008284 [Puccinia graminis f. sp. tritici]
MLGDGIRFFDLRVGFLPDHQQLGFYHACCAFEHDSNAPGCLVGLLQHGWTSIPTETVLMSIKDHWLQEDSKLGTLGEARGKLIFIQRIDWSEIRSRREDYTPIGIPLPPQQFNDNDPDFSILYNPLFITFASGARSLNSPPVTPKMLAIGTGEGASLKNSVNGRIEALIQEQYSNGANDPNNNGQAPLRLGILIFDWYHQLPNLVQSVDG